MRILIADDEAPARKRLRRLLENSPEHVLIAEAANGEEALELVRQHNPDVVLLDIEMPGMDGLQTARALGLLALPPAIIYTTAYDEHALAAFSTPASAYLLKPIRAHELQQALQCCRQENRAQRAPRYLLASVRGQPQRVPRTGIIFLSAQNKYTLVVHEQGEWLLDESLKQLEQQLDDYIRIHRSYLVPVERLQALERAADGSHRLQVLGHADCLPVSRRCLSAVRKALAHPR